MRRRLRKQITIATIFFGILGALGVLIGILIYEPPPPPPPPAPSFAALVVNRAGLLRQDAPDRADLYAVVRNPNANAGLRSIGYTFEVKAGSQTVAQIPGRAYVLPGQEKLLVLLNTAVPPEGTDAAIRFQSPEWVPVDASFRAPSFVPVSRTASVREGNPSTYVVKSVLANESTLDYLRVEVTVLGLDANGTVTGLGQTAIGSLRSGERREFTVSWPLPPGRNVAEVRIVPEVNVFSGAAIQPRPGISGLEPRPTSTPAF
ncbi:MAG: Uncharacterized protein G01um1014106_368 [Parcubacteria group bacterium Gr01-1014_106]|nr:MAG: Uncharacterized protein G01um1014106_368 [Parcubacteria group bacterium Gr01-1014_106]